MFQNILVLYDLSLSSKEALAQAVDWACRLKARLTVLHVISLDARLIAYGFVADREKISAKIEEEVKADIQKLGESVGLDNYQVHVKTGDVLDVTLSMIRDQKTDLVMLGTNARKGLAHFFLGSVAEDVVRYSPVPTVVIRDTQNHFPQKILLPLDFSEFSKEGLHRAVSLCSTFSASLDVVHVLALADAYVTDPQIFAGRSKDLLEEIEAQAMKRLQEVVASVKGMSVQSHLRTGRPADEITNLARKLGSHLIVMPTHGRSGVGHLLIGSVAEAVIRQAPCDVFSFVPAPHTEMRIKAGKELG